MSRGVIYRKATGRPANIGRRLKKVEHHHEEEGRAPRTKDQRLTFATEAKINSRHNASFEYNDSRDLHSHGAHYATEHSYAIFAQQKLSRLILSLIALPCLVSTCEIHLLGPIVIEPRQKAVNGINTLSSIDLPRLCVAAGPPTCRSKLEK